MSASAATARRPSAAMELLCCLSPNPKPILALATDLGLSWKATTAAVAQLRRLGFRVCTRNPRDGSGRSVWVPAGEWWEITQREAETYWAEVHGE